MLGGTPSQASHRTGKGGPNGISPVFSRNWKLRNSSCNQIPPPSISIEKEKGGSGNNVCSKGTIACWFPRCIKLLIPLQEAFDFLWVPTKFHKVKVQRSNNLLSELQSDICAPCPQKNMRLKRRTSKQIPANRGSRKSSISSERKPHIGLDLRL